MACLHLYGEGRKSHFTSLHQYQELPLPSLPLSAPQSIAPVGMTRQTLQYPPGSVLWPLAAEPPKLLLLLLPFRLLGQLQCAGG